MNLIHKWEGKNLYYLIEKINQLFEEIFSAGRVSSRQMPASEFAPPMDIYETEREVVVTAEVPGLRQEDINISIKDNILSLDGERKFERNLKKEHYRRIERNYGPFRKTFALPPNIYKEKIEAKLIDGVLYIQLPKAASVSIKEIEIEIKD